MSSSNGKNPINSFTVLMLQPQFSVEDMLRHFANANSPAGTATPLTAKVTRFWRENDKSPMQPVGATVDSDLAFVITGIQAESASASRYLLDVILAEDLVMSAGVLVKVGGSYAEGEIKPGMQMRIFVDCDAKRGAIYSYVPDPAQPDIIVLPQPEGMSFNPEPTNIVPYCCRPAKAK